MTCSRPAQSPDGTAHRIGITWLWYRPRARRMGDATTDMGAETAFQALTAVDDLAALPVMLVLVPVLFLVAAGVGFVLLPAAILAAELVLVSLAAAAALALRVMLPRPWIVQAVTPDADATVGRSPVCATPAR